MTNSRTQPSFLPPDIDEQLDTVDREIKRRRQHFATRVGHGRMRPAKAEREIRQMEAVRDTLIQVRGVRHVRRTLDEMASSVRDKSLT